MLDRHLSHRAVVVCVGAASRLDHRSHAVAILDDVVDLHGVLELGAGATGRDDATVGVSCRRAGIVCR